MNLGVKEPLDIPSFVQSRWESLLNCVDRILNLWNHLESCTDDDERLQSNLADPEFQLYVYVLYVLLHKLVGYIIFFQKSTLLYDQVNEKIKDGYVLFGRMLLKSKREDPITFEHLCDIDEFSNHFIGRYIRITELIELTKAKNPKRRDIEGVCFTHVREFVLAVVLGMKNRIDYGNY